MLAAYIIHIFSLPYGINKRSDPINVQLPLRLSPTSGQTWAGIWYFKRKIFDIVRVVSNAQESEILSGTQERGRGNGREEHE